MAVDRSNFSWCNDAKGREGVESEHVATDRCEQTVLITLEMQSLLWKINSAHSCLAVYVHRRVLTRTQSTSNQSIRELNSLGRGYFWKMDIDVRAFKISSIDGVSQVRFNYTIMVLAKFRFEHSIFCLCSRHTITAVLRPRLLIQMILI